MTLEEYRKSELSAQLAALLKDPVLATAIEVALQGAPVNGGGKVSEIPHITYVQHGIDRGYAMFPNVLQLLATAPVEGGEVEATYAAPVEEKEAQE